MSYKFTPIDVSDRGLTEVSELLRRNMSYASHLTLDFLRWQYLEHPLGKVIGFNAHHNGALVSHYALTPLRIDYRGETLAGLLSVNTATDEEHRGPAMLFPRLAKISFKKAAELDFKCAIGVANALSTRGFTALGFKVICSLDAKLGWGMPSNRKERIEPEFSIVWNTEELLWRIACPRGEDSAHSHIYQKASWLLGPSPRAGIQAVFGRSLQENAFSHQKCPISPISLYLGLDPNISWKHSLFASIPMRFRPSPLNFIYLDLDDNNRELDPMKIQIQTLDLDIL